eukprot:3511039-Pyramimonas_sp.AAC.1
MTRKKAKKLGGVADAASCQAPESTAKKAFDFNSTVDSRQSTDGGIKGQPNERIADRPAVRRPDIVLIYRLRGDRELPPAFTPLGKGDDRRIVMLKVSHAALGLMSAREAEKRKKYEDTLEKLRSDGWEPVLYTLVLGTLGEIPSTAALVLEELGVCGSELDKLLADIHMIAIGKAD